MTDEKSGRHGCNVVHVSGELLRPHVSYSAVPFIVPNDFYLFEVWRVHLAPNSETFSIYSTNFHISYCVVIFKLGNLLPKCMFHLLLKYQFLVNKGNFFKNST